MKYFSHLNTSVRILEAYKGQQPFVIFLRDFFKQDKKYGSKDRKQISQLCYSYFRLGKAGLDLPVQDRILTAYFLCSQKPDELLEHLKPKWNKAAALTTEKKVLLLHAPFSIEHVFPWDEELSEGIVHQKFCESFFIQPDLFLRIRPGKEKIVLTKLNNAAISFQQPAPDCIALANGTKIETIIELNKEAVVQDYSSQQAGKLLPNFKSSTFDRKPSVWDCCAASGGKSILAKDILGDIDLTVSDIRESIMANLKKRFSEAGIQKYKNVVTDLYAPFPFLDSRSSIFFDLIIADAPCTGSGTWGRTPEQVFYFEKEKIDEYAMKQEKIVSNVIPSLKPGGYFLYITCSVFKKENENRIDFIKQNFSLQLIEMEIIKGYDKKADTLFAALLQKPL